MICIVVLFDFLLIVCCLGVVCWIICVVLEYLVCVGELCSLVDLVYYNCLGFMFVGECVLVLWCF